ncbi:hypothetical protein GMMP15_250007 [Candidatus Magnetomoraceae bacterium gMMP-15]
MNIILIYYVVDTVSINIILPEQNCEKNTRAKRAETDFKNIIKSGMVT